jgi:hypothetical protein
VVSEPLLPSGNQGRKGGFATLPKQPLFACGMPKEIPDESGLYTGQSSGKTGRELGNTQKLGVLPDQTWQAILVENQEIGHWLDSIRLLRFEDGVV